MEKTKIDLKQSLPVTVTGIYEPGALLDALSGELTRLSDAIWQASCDLSLSTASGRLDLWEQELGMGSYKGFSLSDRRSMLLAKLRLFDTQTVETLQGMLRCYVPNGSITVTCPDISTGVTATVAEPHGLIKNTFILGEALRNAVPAHLGAVLHAISNLQGNCHSRTLHICTYTTIIPIGG